MDVIFTIVSRNYAAQAATLMESLALAEPAARRIVVATDGPIPALERFAEVIDARSFDIPFAAMSVYYDALELNTAAKPYVFKGLLADPRVKSATYLDPDIYVYRPLDAVRKGLAEAQLVLTPHLTRSLRGPALPNDHVILKSGVYNLGFCSMRNEPRSRDLAAWWAERCEFDCRVDLANGLFTDQRWMDLSPGFVDSVAIHRAPDLNLAYWNLEGRTLARDDDGWTVDGVPLVFFHFSGFDPLRPRILSKHQNRLSVAAGSPLAALLADFAAAMLRNGHARTSPIPYLHARFESGRAVTPLMRRRALRAARGGERFAAGLGDATSAWFDASDPALTEPGLPDVTRLMEQVWHENPGADPFDRTTAEGRLGLHQWVVDNAEALGLDAQSIAAAQKLAKRSGGSARNPAPQAWCDEPWSGPAVQVWDWFRRAVEGSPRACRAILAARKDLRERFSDDPDGLLAWCLGPEAAAGRFAVDLLPAETINDLARNSAPLFRAAQMAERGPPATDLRRRLNAGFDAGERAGWPPSLTAPLREPFLGSAKGYPAPFVRLFLDIWEDRPDLQRHYPLNNPLSRLRYLRWLVAGGFAEYGVQPSALPASVRRHPLMRLAEATIRGRSKPPAPPSPAHVRRLLVVDDAGDEAIAPGVVIYDATTGRFSDARGAAPAPREAEQVCFLTAPGLAAADAVALHAKGVSWRAAVAVWSPQVVEALSDRDPVLGFIDEIWTSAPIDRPLPRPVIVRSLAG